MWKKIELLIIKKKGNHNEVSHQISLFKLMPICPYPMVYVCLANGTFVLHILLSGAGQSISQSKLDNRKIEAVQT